MWYTFIRRNTFEMAKFAFKDVWTGEISIFIMTFRNLVLRHIRFFAMPCNEFAAWQLQMLFSFSLCRFCLGCIHLSETTIFAVRVRLLKKSYKETRKRKKDSNLICFCYLTSWVGSGSFWKGENNAKMNIDFIILSL